MVLTPLLAAGLDSGDRHLPEHARLDHVGRVRSITCSFPGWRAGRSPERVAPSSVEDGRRVWMLGLIPGTLYIVFNPDGIPHPDRWSYGPWLQALKYTPLPHLASFVFGVMLADLDEIVPRPGRLRLVLGIFGFGGNLRLLSLSWARVPYASFTTAC